MAENVARGVRTCLQIVPQTPAGVGYQVPVRELTAHAIKDRGIIETSAVAYWQGAERRECTVLAAIPIPVLLRETGGTPSYMPHHCCGVVLAEQMYRFRAWKYVV